MDFINIRVFFSKTGRAKYISHLDLYRAMTRAVKRAALPVWLTEGFNPRVYMTFALPLALGIEGANESFDMRLTRELPFREIAERLDFALKGAEGLKVNSAVAPVRDADEIEKAEYEITSPHPKELADFFSRPEIIVEKKTKKGTRVIDAKPLLKWENGFLTLPAGNRLNINPWNVLGGVETVNVMRTAVLCADGGEFA
ncbi:MAG: TIGR03936 family radical SAM-associated protein [Oscillospiraceae bacterium]|jgi:radical SAM-linked protein|nr:TIGR03936 family radical SAM-associated protein [Oscillospiraceae bacterium]